MVRKLSLALVIVFTLALAVSAQVVINEIVYDPVGDETSGEWVELYNTGGSSVDLSGWQLTDQDGHTYIIPSGSSISAGGYLVVHTGAGTDTSTDLYAGFTAGIWDNTGDEVLLKDSTGAGIDYIQYAGGSGDSPPSGLTWSGDISGTSEGNSLALIPDGNDQDSATNWIPRLGSYITQGSANAQQPDPTVTVAITYPTGKTYVSTCEQAQATITVTNNDSAASIYDTQVTATLPSDFYYISDDEGGNYNAVNHTITWNAGEITTSGSWIATVTFRPSCSAFTNQEICADVTWTPYSGAAGNTVPTEYSSLIDVEPVVLGVTKLVYNESAGETELDAGSTTHAARGQSVVFVVQLTNNGDGDAVDGVEIEDVLGDGLSFISLKDESANDVSYTGSGTAADPYTWSTEAIDHGTAKKYYLTATVIGCEDLVNQVTYTWSCTDQGGTPICELTGYASASIALTLKEPDVSYTVSPDPVTIDYCSGSTVTITVTNGNPTTPDPSVGTAHGFTLTMDGLPSDYQVTNVSAATYDAGTGAFAVGDIAANTQTQFSFDLSLNSGACSPTESGTLLFTPYYENDCGKAYFPPVTLDSFSLTGQPSISITKTGQRAVDVGETGTNYTLSVHYEGPDNQTLTIVDDYPDVNDTANGWGSFTVADPAGGTDDGDKITWTQTFNNGDDWSKTIKLNAPTDPCAGGNTYTNRLSISPTSINDCNSCTIPINDSGSFEIYVNNNYEEAITDHNKTVTYSNINSNGVHIDADSAEDCTDIQYTTSVTFNTGTWAPQTWNTILFRDDMNDAQTYVSLDSVTVNGTNYMSAVSVTNTSGYLEIDLSGLDGTTAPKPNSGATLKITYTLHAPDGSEGSFIDWSHLTVPGFSVGTCDVSEGTYDQGVDVSISESSLGLSLSGPQIIDKCGTYTYTINISREDFQGYDALVTFDTHGNYTYIPGSTDFSGFTDEAGTTISSFEPTVNGNELSWDLGDLSSVGTIQISLRKCCSPTDTSYSATVEYNDNCHNQDDASITSRSGSSSTSSNADYLASGHLRIDIEPSSYFTVNGYPQFKVYLLNTGDGAAYDADLSLTFNGSFVYRSYGSSEVAPTSFTGSSGDTSVTWHYDSIPAGQKSVLYVTGELTGCDASSVDGSATWGCCSQDTECQSDLPVTDTMTLQYPSSDVVVISHTMTPSLVDYCGDPVTFTINTKNYGPAVAYHPWVQETLADGLSYIAGTAEYSLDNGTNWTAFPGEYSSYSGQILSWDFESLLSTTDGHGNNVLGSGDTITIRFQAEIADCTAATTFASGNRYSDAIATYDLPCAHTNSGDPITSSPISRLNIASASPHVKITVWGENLTAGTAYTQGTVNAASGDTIVWKVKIENDGDYRTKEISLQDILPSNVTYSSWAQVSGESDVNLAFDSGDGTSGSPLTWHVDNSDQGLDIGQESTIEITTTVNSCTSVTTDTATTNWGCCSVDQGSESDSADLKTQPAPSDLTITVTPQNFSTCGGDVTIKIKNNDSFHTAYHFHLSDALPTSSGTYAWVYDSSNGGAQITSSNSSGHTFTSAEEEPVLSSNGTVLEWMDSTSSGNITNGNAYIAPGETLTITFHAKASGNYCDSSFANDANNPDVGTIPTDNNLLDLSYQDLCGNTLSCSQVATTVDPVQSDVDIVSVVATPPLGMSGDTVHWTITLKNNGDGTAGNVTLESAFGSGYDDTSVTNITPSGTWSSGTNTVAWSGITLDPGAEATFSYDIVISGVGGLTNTVTSTGECLDAAGAVICHHSYDQLIGQAAGVDFDKSITDIPEPGSIATDGNSGQATIGNVITYQIQVHYLGSGTYENTSITDELPSGLEFVDQSVIQTPSTVSASFSQNGNTLTWTMGSSSPPSFTDNVSVTITVRARVTDDSGNVWSPATALTNTAYTDFTWNGISYDHTASAYGAKITEQNTVTVIEPWIAADSNYTKTSSPACDAADHTGTAVQANDTIDYTFTARNTGTSPAYDLVFVDTIPVGMRGTAPSVTSVTVSSRTLSSGTDYTTSWDSSTGTLTITLENTTAAAIQPNELLTIVYRATVDSGVGAGSYLDNAARVDSYTCLPGTPTSPEGPERTYGSSVGSGNYGYLPEATCQHHTEALPANTKTVSAQITAPSGAQTGGNAQIGEPLTYTITITVPDGTTAYDMLFSDLTPDGLTVTGATCTVAGTSTGTPSYSENANGTTSVSVSNIGDIASGSTVTVTITGTLDQIFSSANAGDVNANGIVDRGDVLWNGASYSWNTVNNDETTRITVDSNEVSTTIQEPDLSLSKTSDDADGIVAQGENVTYTITVHNADSTGIAYDPEITDVVPLQLRDPTVDSVSLNGTTLTTSDYDYSYSSSTGEMNFSFTHSGSNTIDADSDLIIVYHVTIPTDIGAGRTGSRALINDANAQAYSLPAGTNDSGRREYAVGPVQVPLTTALAEIVKAQSPSDGSTVNSGDTITYTMTLPDPSIQATLYDVTVADTVPDGLSVTDVTLSDGQTPSHTVSGRTVTATFERIDPGAQATIIITCSVRSTFDSGSAIQPGHAFTNQATLDWCDAASSDSNRRDHVAASNTVVAYYQGTAIVLTPNHTRETFPGSMITYRHILRNLGTTADTVTLTYGPSSQGWSWLLYLGDGSGNITSGPIASGDSITIAAGAHQDLILRAFVPTDTPVGTTDVIKLTATGANNSDSVTDITTVRQGKMRLVKEESNDNGATWHTYMQVKSGEEILFRLTFTNIGTEPLRNIRVIDSTPDNTVYVAGSAASGNEGSYTVYYSTDGGGSWTTTEPSPELVTHIRWTYSGTLAPGESHYVTYKVELK